MMAHPLALQLRNLQSLVEIGVDRNTTVVFPAPLMSTIGELGAFLARESAAARSTAVRPDSAPTDATPNGTRPEAPGENGARAAPPLRVLVCDEAMTDECPANNRRLWTDGSLPPN